MGFIVKLLLSIIESFQIGKFYMKSLTKRLCAMIYGTTKRHINQIGNLVHLSTKYIRFKIYLVDIIYIMGFNLNF